MMNGNNLDTNKFAADILHFVEVYKELRKINQNICDESSKLNDLLDFKIKENNDLLVNVEILVKKREDELKQLKNL